MRSSSRCTWAFAGLLLAAGLSPITAQPQPPSGGAARSPSFSPYLNLAGRGNSPAINYFGIVRPEQRLFQQTNQLQQQLGQTNQTLSSSLNGINDQLFTGRGATFGYYSHYYYNSPTSGQGGSGGFRTGGAGGGGAASVFRPGGSGSNIGQAPRPALNNNPRR